MFFTEIMTFYYRFYDLFAVSSRRTFWSFRFLDCFFSILILLRTHKNRV